MQSLDKAKSERPFVFLNVAMTADGKLAPANRRFVPFGSKRDQQHLLELRTTADAVMSGARTVDLNAVKLGPGGAKYRRERLRRGLSEYNLRVVASGSGSLDIDAEIFKHRFSPLIVLTTGRAPKNKLRELEKLGAIVKVCGQRRLNFGFAFHWLCREWGVRRLLCEGGGEINAALFEAGLVDEIHLTVAPIIFGGRNAPTLSDGDGFEHLADAAKFRVKSRKRIGDEIFLVYEAVR